MRWGGLLGGISTVDGNIVESNTISTVTSDAESMKRVLLASSMNTDAASTPLMPTIDRPELVLTAEEAVVKRWPSLDDDLAREFRECCDAGCGAAAT